MRKPGEHRSVTVHVPIKQYEQLVKDAKRADVRYATFVLIAVTFYLDHLAQQRKQAVAARKAADAANSTEGTK